MSGPQTPRYDASPLGVFDLARSVPFRESSGVMLRDRLSGTPIESLLGPTSGQPSKTKRRAGASGDPSTGDIQPKHTRTGTGTFVFFDMPERDRSRIDVIKLPVQME